MFLNINIVVVLVDRSKEGITNKNKAKGIAKSKNDVHKVEFIQRLFSFMVGMLPELLQS